MPSDLSCVPFIEQYFGLWLYEESRFWSQFDVLKKCDLHLHLQSERPAEARTAAREPAKIVGRNAIIQINGKMMKQASSSGGSSTVAVRRQIRAAMNNADITGVALHIDSPGGTAAGTQDLADDVAALAAIKPVIAYVEDLGASAAYWVASQATHIATNRSGMVGSIGTYGVVYDMSGAAAMEGVKAYVVRAGQFKGMGTPGTEVSQEQLAELQRNVDALNSHFLSAVASGRGMSLDSVKTLADGRVHVGDEAKKMGLVDSVESFDAAFARLQSMTTKKRGAKMMADHITPESTVDTTAKEPSMSEVVTPKVATSKEIKAACVGCSSDFVLAQLEAGATMDAVKDAWIEQLAADRDAEQAKSADLSAKLTEAESKAATPPKSGVTPIGSSQSQSVSADPIAEFAEAVKEKQSSGMDRQRAMSLVIAENPQLHQDYLTAYRDGVRQRFA